MSIQSFLKYFFVFGLSFIYSPVHSTDLDYYIGGSLNTNFPLQFYQLGWNGDDICYPNSIACLDTHKGYAWIYEVMSGLVNPGLRFYAGVRTHKNWRLEVSLDGFRSLKASKTKFTNLYYLKENKDPFFKTVSFWDGLILPKAKDLTVSLTGSKYNKDDDQLISSGNSFSELQLLTGLINVYFDFPITNTKFMPYVGLGSGYTLVKANISYHSKYKDKSYTSDQDASFSKLALSARVKAGVDYAFSDKWSYGLEASYTMLKGASDILPYEKHPNQKNNTTILRDIRYLTVTFNAVYFL